MTEKIETTKDAMDAEVLAVAAAEADPAIDNTELVKAFRADGGQLLHVRPERLHGGGWSRGMTLAFRVKSGRIEVATSISHRHDNFTKKIGTKTAITHFNDGKTIFLPIRGKKVIQDLQAALWFIC